MSAAWVAGSVRARLLLGRRLGREGAREVAAAGSLGDASSRLARTEYGREGRLDMGLDEAERAIAATALLQLRLLAGWLPRSALELLRALAGWFELANVEDRLAFMLGAELRHPFTLGGLAVAWPRAAQAQTPHELRAVLAGSLWGDPGAEAPPELHLALRLAWARRLLDEAPEAREWVAGALALLLARVVLSAGSWLDSLPAAQLRLVGPEWRKAATLADLAAGLPREAVWSLEGMRDLEDIWRGEARWWTRVERDAEAMVRQAKGGRTVVVGAAALLAADARRAIAALEASARGASREFEEVMNAAA